jgi:hypothetical protein
MAGAIKIVLDHDGIAAALASDEVAKMVEDAARAIADAAHYPEPSSPGAKGGLEATVETYTAKPGGRLKSARPAASVVVLHPAAVGMEAKHGILVRAAESIGASTVVAKTPSAGSKRKARK